MRLPLSILFLTALAGCFGSDPSTPTSADAGTTCTATCGANEHCANDACVCDAGFVKDGDACKLQPLDGRTQAEICNLWTAGHVVTDARPFIPAAGASQCAPGALSAAGHDDVLKRVNTFRQLVGLGIAAGSAGLDPGAQRCAVIAAWNPPSLQAHNPPASWTCYDAQGAAAAGKSNIAWGQSAADAVDGFMEDQGNETTLGHRRWIIHPPLGPVGVGYYEGGNNGYKRTECLQVFATEGGGPSPDWYALPPPGFSPVEISSWIWSFHGHTFNAAKGSVSVAHMPDGAALAVDVLPLPAGYGDTALSFSPKGWVPKAGETYRVTVTGVPGAPITYDVKPVSCQ